MDMTDLEIIEMTKLLAALRAYEQCDHEGIFATVSREALDKAIALLSNAAHVDALKKRTVPQGER